MEWEYEIAAGEMAASYLSLTVLTNTKLKTSKAHPFTPQSLFEFSTTVFYGLTIGE